jgi:hypothetical protein
VAKRRAADEEIQNLLPRQDPVPHHPDRRHPARTVNRSGGFDLLRKAEAVAEEENRTNSCLVAPRGSRSAPAGGVPAKLADAAAATASGCSLLRRRRVYRSRPSAASFLQP